MELQRLHKWEGLKPPSPPLPTVCVAGSLPFQPFVSQAPAPPGGGQKETTKVKRQNKMVHYFEIDWDAPWSPLYGHTIDIPENTILWRSYDASYPAIGNRFAYYSSKSIAEGYRQNNTRQLGHFISTRPLRLLDYRFMRVLLSHLITTNAHDKSIHDLTSIMLSFGLCSLGHQIELVKTRYIGPDKTTQPTKQMEQSIQSLEEYYKAGNIIEQAGIRIAETTNDAYTMGFLQELFNGVFDGFISPRLYSPSVHPEIIIFNPSVSGIEELPTYPVNKTKIKVLKIRELLNSNHGYILIDNVKKGIKEPDIKLNLCMDGGNNSHYLDIADNLLNTKANANELLKEYRKGIKAGTKWNKKID